MQKQRANFSNTASVWKVMSKSHVFIRESSLYGIQNFSCVHITWSYNDIFCYCQTPLFSNQGIREFPLGFPFSLMFVIYQ